MFHFFIWVIQLLSFVINWIRRNTLKAGASSVNFKREICHFFICMVKLQKCTSQWAKTFSIFSSQQKIREDNIDGLWSSVVNPLSADSMKCSNTLNFLSVFGRFVGLVLKELICNSLRELVPFAQLKKLFVNLQLSTNFIKSITPPWIFTSLFKLCKWYQITQNTCFRLWTCNFSLVNHTHILSKQAQKALAECVILFKY